MKHIVKRNNRSETYDERKLYASIYASCLSVREPENAAELIAEKVCGDVGEWLQHKSEVSSADIRKEASTFLETLNPNAAFLYQHHRIIW